MRSRNVIWILSSVTLMFIRWQTQLQLTVYRIKAERKKVLIDSVQSCYNNCFLMHLSTCFSSSFPFCFHTQRCLKCKICSTKLNTNRKSHILTGRFMTLLPGSSSNREAHHEASGKILIAPVQPCREPCEQFCISDCVTLCISFLL